MMSADPQSEAAEDWCRWENYVVGGMFPLHRLLASSRDSAVFLTEHPTQNLPSAAIKLIRADMALAEVQLSYWSKAATLSHPHLIGLFDSGRCRLEERQLIFVVMEHADESLDQVIPCRSLTPVEVRELLPPTLDALKYLHGKGLVQGQLKPPNILGVEGQLKLASDCIRPSFATAARIRRPTLYDPPEATRGRMSAAGDMWALGITLVEALTQQRPQMNVEGLPGETACLPAAVPRAFEVTLRQCLSRYPGNRPTPAEIEPQFRLKPHGA